MSDPAGDDCPGLVGGSRLPGEVWILLVANVCIALGFGVVAPVLPQYARHFGVSIGAATFVITAFAVMRLIATPGSGLLVQRWGERRVYLSGLLLVALSTGACAFAADYWQLLLFRSLGGFGSAMFTVSSLGLMIRLSPPDARGRVAGLFSSAFLVGSVGGPVLGSLTAGLGLAAPFAVYGVTLMVAVAVVAARLRHSALGAGDDASEPVIGIGAALRQGAYRSALSSNFAAGWSVFGLRIALVPLFVAEVLGRGPAIAGLVLAAFAVGNVASTLPSGRLSDRVGRRALVIGGLIVAGASTAAVAFVQSVPAMLVATIIAGAAAGTFTSPQQAAVADVVGGRSRSGTAVATFQMTSDLGAIVGSLAVGALAQYASFGWAFVVSGGLLLAAAVPWAFSRETRRVGGPLADPLSLGMESAGERP